MTEPVSEVKGLTKRYGEYTAVNGITFEVKRGEVLAILGPNGAGKTTTVEMLEGYRSITSGKATVLGVDPQHGDRYWRSKIGMVLQSTSLDNELTVKETLSLYAHLYTNPRSMGEVLNLVGLDGVENKRVGQLSGGQKRRVDVALGIIGRPELLFLDEPTTGFDPSARRVAWEMIKHLCEEGLTVILTTHYMEEAQFLADRILLIVGGKIVADAPPDQVGGELRDQSYISFQADRQTLATLPSSLQKLLTVNDRHAVIRTIEPTKTSLELIRWAEKNGVSLSDFSVSRPSLEDVYLQLVDKADGKGGYHE